MSVFGNRFLVSFRKRRRNRGWFALENFHKIVGHSNVLVMFWLFKQVSFYQLRHIWPIVNGRQEAESQVCLFFRCKKNTIYTVHRICVLGVTQPWIFFYPVCLEFSFGAGNNPDKGSIISRLQRFDIFIFKVSKVVIYIRYSQIMF